MATAFEKAAFLQDISLFKKCLRKGYDHSEQDFFNRTAIFGLRQCYDASVEEFVDVLHAFIDAGADINHVDVFGNTVLLLSQVDNLGVALVEVGAWITYELDDYSKRGLANAAIYGCTRTIDAMVSSRLNLPNQIQQKDFDSCLDRAARAMAYNPIFDDMTGIVKLIVDYGANPNLWNTLHHSVRYNHVLVSTLVSLGARTDTLAWDFYRGVKNTPLHRMTDIMTRNVFEALVNPATDFNVKDKAGQSPLMALMRSRSLLHTDDDIMERFNWLIGHGASCLPVDKKGKRVSSYPRSKISPFKEIIDAKIGDENWYKRREAVILRAVLQRRIKRRKSNRNLSLLYKVANFPIDGVFRHIVTFL